MSAEIAPRLAQINHLLSGEKDWYDIDGGHFGLLYHPSDLFDEASTVQAAYLTRHLLHRSQRAHIAKYVAITPLPPTRPGTAPPYSVVAMLSDHWAQWFAAGTVIGLGRS